MTEDRTPEGSPAPTPESSTEPPPPLAPYVAASTPPPPPAAAQPAVAWQAPPVAATTGGRTALAAAAGVLLLILGVLGGLLGLLVVVVGGNFVASLGDLGYFPELEGRDPTAILGGVVAFFGIIIVIYSAVYILAGIGTLRSRGWGRVTGIVIGVLSGLFWLLSLSSPESGSLVVPIVMLGVHAFVVVALLMFWRTKTA